MKIINKIIIISSVFIFSNIFNLYAATNIELDFMNIIKIINTDTINEYRYNNEPLSAIKVNELVFYTNDEGEIFNDLRETVNENDLFAIAVNRAIGSLTVYKYNILENRYNIPVVSFFCSPNKIKTPVGLYHMGEKYRWREMFGNVYCQYCYRFFDHFLIHSPVYSKMDGNTLKYKTYNGLLGEAQSSGCVRLRSGEAKWIYDNVKEGSPIVIYDSNVIGPLERIPFAPIKSNQTYDPTDAEMLTKFEK